MSHQTKVFGLRALASQIDNERIKLLGDMPKPNTAAHMALQRKIDGWNQTYDNVTRDLKSRSHFNHMIHNQNRFGAHAFQANQRLQSQEANVKELANELARVALAIARLTKALAAGDGPEKRAFEAMEHALSNWMDSVKHSQDGVMGQMPANVKQCFSEVQVHASKPTQPKMIPGPGGVDIFTLILAYFVLIKAMAKNKN